MNRREGLRASGFGLRPAVCLAFAMMAACNGETGTITITLTEPAGSTLLETDIQRLRIQLTSPVQTVESDRSGSGFSLSFSADANGGNGQFLLEGFDGNSTLIAVGESPLIPINAIDADITIFVAPPLSVAATMGAISQPRQKMSVGATEFGAVFVGGIDGGGFASANVDSYNAFTQQELNVGALQDGSGSNTPRVQSALAVDAGGDVYIYAGSDADGNPTSTLFQLDPTIIGSGAITLLGSADGSLARGATVAVPLDTPDEFALSGMPVIEFSTPESIMALSQAGITGAAAPAAAVVGSDGEVTAMFIGDGNPGSGVLRFHGEAIDLPIGNPSVLRHGHALTGAPGGVIVELAGVIDGSDAPTADAVVFDAAAGTATTKPATLTTARLDAAVAATQRYLIIAGGQSDDVPCTVQAPCTLVPTVEILDSTTLGLKAMATLTVPRTGASAVALPNDQILIVGGTDANGAPIGTLEMFTPDLATSF